LIIYSWWVLNYYNFIECTGLYCTSIFNLLFYSIIFVFFEDPSDEEIHFAVGGRSETTPMTASPSTSASRPRQQNQVFPNSVNKYDIYFFYSNLLFLLINYINCRSSKTTETASSVSKDKWCLTSNHIIFSYIWTFIN